MRKIALCHCAEHTYTAAQCAQCRADSLCWLKFFHRKALTHLRTVHSEISPQKGSQHFQFVGIMKCVYSQLPMNKLTAQLEKLSATMMGLIVLLTLLSFGIKSCGLLAAGAKKDRADLQIE